MNVILFGATGMIGQGILREALLDDRVGHVTSVVRAATGRRHPKLTELVLDDLFAIATLSARLPPLDACLFCAGISAAGLSEAAYARITHDLTLAVAGELLRLNPALAFLYVSGAGTDATGRFMWARVKGRTEDALLAMPFRAAYMLRPGMIQPLDGIASRTRWYRLLYAVTAPVTPLLVRRLPGLVTTTRQLGRAMLAVARDGYVKPILESADINAAA